MNPVVIGAGTVAALALLNKAGKKSNEISSDRSNNRVFLSADRIDAYELVIPSSTQEGAKMQIEMLAVDSWLANVLWARANNFGIFLSDSGIAKSGNSNQSSFSFFPANLYWAGTIVCNYNTAVESKGADGYLTAEVKRGQVVTFCGGPVLINPPEPWGDKKVYFVEMTNKKSGYTRNGIMLLVCPEMKEYFVACVSGDTYFHRTGKAALTPFFTRPDGSVTHGFVDGPAREKCIFS